MSFSDDDDASSTEQMIARSLGVPTSRKQQKQAQQERKRAHQVDSPVLSLSSTESSPDGKPKPASKYKYGWKGSSPEVLTQLERDWSEKEYGHPQFGRAGGGVSVAPPALSEIEELAKAMAYAKNAPTPWVPKVAAAPKVAAPVPAAPAPAARAPAPSTGRRAPAREFPHQLLNFTFNERDRMEIFEEINTRDKKDPGPYRVASFITVGSPGSAHYHRFDLSKDLDSQGLRKLAMNFGCTTVGSMSMFACRRAMAAKVDLGTTYDNNTVPLPTSTANDRRVNSHCRAINTVFKALFRDRFVSLNDQLKRKQFESTAGSNPIKLFWLEASDYYNDSTNNDEIGNLTYSGEDEDKHIHRRDKAVIGAAGVALLPRR